MVSGITGINHSAPLTIFFSRNLIDLEILALGDFEFEIGFRNFPIALFKVSLD